jgi:hypothetical protein
MTTCPAVVLRRDHLVVPTSEPIRDHSVPGSSVGDNGDRRVDTPSAVKYTTSTFFPVDDLFLPAELDPPRAGRLIDRFDAGDWHAVQSAARPPHIDPVVLGTFHVSDLSHLDDEVEHGSRHIPDAVALGKGHHLSMPDATDLIGIPGTRLAGR